MKTKSTPRISSSGQQHYNSTKNNTVSTYCRIMLRIHCYEETKKERYNNTSTTTTRKEKLYQRFEENYFSIVSMFD